MKKIISTIASLALCAGTMTAITANAGDIYVLERRFEAFPELKAYLEYTAEDIYKNIEYADELITVENPSGTGSSFGVNFNSYKSMEKEEAEVLSNYISKEYPEITVDEEVFTYRPNGGSETAEAVNIKLTYGDELSFEEKFEIAIDIKEGTGLICEYTDYLNVLSVEYCGDVNSDNAITASDAAMVLSYYAQGQTSTASAYAEGEVDYSIIADYNNDGAVTSVDAALILSDYAEGQIS